MCGGFYHTTFLTKEGDVYIIGRDISTVDQPIKILFKNYKLN